MKKINFTNQDETKIQRVALVVLRVAIGWFFLYEGIAKMLIPDWTSAGYLVNSRWIFSGFFNWLASDIHILKIVDLLNIWGLSLIGISLVTGFLIRYACVSGILLLAFYYIANPPFIITAVSNTTEGHYLFIDKNLILMVALSVLLIFPTGLYMGVDGMLIYLRRRRKSGKSNTDIISSDMVSENMGANNEGSIDRREILKHLATIPILGAFVYATVRKYKWEKINAVTGATIKLSDTRLDDLKGDLPKGEINKIKISRMILGGNIIGGWAHSRDLIYVPSLFKAYNTEKKIFETLMIAEQAGINTMNITHSQYPVINKYKKIYNSNLQTICQIHPTKDDIYSHVKKAIDNGVDLIQIQGSCCDWRVRDGEMDVLAECIDYIRGQGYPAGLGAHSIQALIECDKVGIEPDFYMKTLHHDQYWSAHPRENRVPYSVDGEKSIDHNQFHDNIFCLYPEESINFMKRKNKPFIAFKVLAGGSIQPDDGFRYAFENGADFICVGMFDYQIVDNINTGVKILDNLDRRDRGWFS